MEAWLLIGAGLVIVFWICRIVLRAVGRVLSPVLHGTVKVLNVTNDSLEFVSEQLERFNEAADEVNANLERKIAELQAVEAKRLAGGKGNDRD